MQWWQADSVVKDRLCKLSHPNARAVFRYGMSKLRLLHGIVVSKSGERQGSLSYTCLRELFLHKLSELGFDAKQFGLHSLRSGRATAAAQAGVPDRLSESAEDGYVKDSMSA